MLDFLKKVVLLAEVAENDCAAMIARQIWPGEVIIAVGIAMDAADEITSNALVQMLLPIDSKLRLSNERTTEALQTHRNSNKDVVFEFRSSSEFDDRLCVETSKV